MYAQVYADLLASPVVAMVTLLRSKNSLEVVLRRAEAKVILWKLLCLSLSLLAQWVPSLNWVETPTQPALPRAAHCAHPTTQVHLKIGTILPLKYLFCLNFMLSKSLQKYTNLQHKFLHMGSIEYQLQPNRLSLGLHIGHPTLHIVQRKFSWNFLFLGLW